MTTHQLKTLPSYFDGVVAGDKTFEVRFDDRGFQAGDDVVLREWDPARRCVCRDVQTRHFPDCTRYTGREVRAAIGWVMASFPRKGSIPAFDGGGYVVFSLCDTEVTIRPAPTGAAAADGARDAREGMQRIAAARKPGGRS